MPNPSGRKKERGKGGSKRKEEIHPFYIRALDYPAYGVAKSAFHALCAIQKIEFTLILFFKCINFFVFDFQILPSSEFTKGPGGFFNATVTLPSTSESGRYICLANNPRGHDHKEVFVVVGGGGGGAGGGRRNNGQRLLGGGGGRGEDGDAVGGK
jgi:hypothetical protein